MGCGVCSSWLYTGCRCTHCGSMRGWVLNVSAMLPRGPCTCMMHMPMLMWPCMRTWPSMCKHMHKHIDMYMDISHAHVHVHTHVEQCMSHLMLAHCTHVSIAAPVAAMWRACGMGVRTEEPLFPCAPQSSCLRPRPHPRPHIHRYGAALGALPGLHAPRARRPSSRSSFVAVPLATPAPSRARC